VEVAELVDRDALEQRAQHTRNGCRLPLIHYQKDWGHERLTYHLQALLLEQKAGRVRDGFDQNILLIDCDEPGLDDDEAVARLESCPLSLGRIGRAFVFLRRDYRLAELGRES
jgi:hypothetical protein